MRIKGEDEISEILGSEKVISFEHEARKREVKACYHERYVVDQRRGTVHCADCEETISAFHAMVELARYETRFRRQMAALEERKAELDAYKPWLVAVKKLERIWRGKMLPQCPRCELPIKAADLAASGRVSAEPLSVV